MIDNAINGKCSIARGTYTGDGTENRAIAHGLGVTPKYIEILSTTSAGVIFIDGTTGKCVGTAPIWSTHDQTTPDATNFYVGKPETAGFWGNDDTYNYIWFAFY